MSELSLIESMTISGGHDNCGDHDHNHDHEEDDIDIWTTYVKEISQWWG